MSGNEHHNIIRKYEDVWARPSSVSTKMKNVEEGWLVRTLLVLYRVNRTVQRYGHSNSKSDNKIKKKTPMPPPTTAALDKSKVL